MCTRQAREPTLGDLYPYQEACVPTHHVNLTWWLYFFLSSGPVLKTKLAVTHSAFARSVQYPYEAQGLQGEPTEVGCDKLIDR